MVDKKGLTRTGEVKDPFVLSFCSDIIKTYIDKANKEDISKWSIKELVDFLEKECLKRQKIADLSFYFEFQVVVAVVGFLWHS